MDMAGASGSGGGGGAGGAVSFFFFTCQSFGRLNISPLPWSTWLNCPPKPREGRNCCSHQPGVKSAMQPVKPG